MKNVIADICYIIGLFFPIVNEVLDMGIAYEHTMLLSIYVLCMANYLIKRKEVK